MINLLPPKRLINMRIARTNTVLRRYIELVLVGICVLVAALFAARYFLTNHQRSVQTTLDESQKKVAALQQTQTDAEQLSVTINTIAGLLARNISFSDMLVKIGATMPTGTVLTGMQFSTEDTNAPFIVSADIESEERAAVLRNNLVSSDLFTDASIKSITRKTEEPQPSTTQTEDSEAAPAQQVDRYKYTAIIHTTLKPVEEAR